MLLLISLTIFGFASCQQVPYGPSQLDQYARLLNSGNLNGFGLLQSAINQGQIGGWGDLVENGAPRLNGLPPLPLTMEEVMKQLTSTAATPTTRGTARPTTPTVPPPLGRAFDINPIPELPPRPEAGLKGTYNEDGEFQPEEKKEEDALIQRNQIQGTKIRDFPDPDNRRIPAPEDRIGKIEDYEADDFYDDPSLRVSANKAHSLAQRDGLQSGKRVPPPSYPRYVKPRVPVGQQTPQQAAAHANYLAQYPQQAQQAQPQPIAQQVAQQLAQQYPQQAQPQYQQPTPQQYQAQAQAQAQYQAQAQAQQQAQYQAQQQARQPLPQAQYYPQQQQQQYQPQQVALPQQRVGAAAAPTVYQAPIQPAPQAQPIAVNTPTPFVFRPKPIDRARDPADTNLLTEIEEYDDFLDQATTYREQIPSGQVYNPYAQLPDGRLPQVPQAPAQAAPAPQQQPQYSPPVAYQQQAPAQVAAQPVQQPLPQAAGAYQAQVYQHPLFAGHPLFNHQAQAAPSFVLPSSATEHPLLRLFDIFSSGQAHAFAAPTLRLDGPAMTHHQFAMSPPQQANNGFFPPNRLQLVDIQQRPIAGANAFGRK